MRFTLGTFFGIALGVVAAPVVALMPSIGPSVLDAQSRMLDALKVVSPAAPANANANANANATSTGPSPARTQPRRAGIVSLAAIAAAEDDELAKAEAVPAPVETASFPTASAPPPFDEPTVRRDRAATAVPSERRAAPPVMDGPAADPHRDSTATNLEPAPDALAHQAGVLDRLFATYDRVEEE